MHSRPINTVRRGACIRARGQIKRRRAQRMFKQVRLSRGAVVGWGVHEGQPSATVAP